MSLILSNPVRQGVIYLTPGTLNGGARWFRSQRQGCTGFSWEPPLGSCPHYHRGVDIARGSAGCDDDILAPASGTVFYSGVLNDGNHAICIRHDGGWATGYGHLNGRSVSRGARVTKGQKIGTCGRTGNATGCHLHLGLKSGFPSTGDVNAFWRDSVGTWRDAWPHLSQNVTVRPKDGINIRTGPGSGSTPSPVFARTNNGRILRAKDGVDLGSITTMRKWGGVVAGASYDLGGTPGTSWDKIYLDGAYRCLATPLGVRSV